MAYVQDPDKGKGTREVIIEFLKPHVENKFLTYLERHHKEKGWVVLEGDQPTIIKREEDFFSKIEFSNFLCLPEKGK